MEVKPRMSANAVEMDEAKKKKKQKNAWRKEVKAFQCNELNYQFGETFCKNLS